VVVLHLPKCGNERWSLSELESLLKFDIIFPYSVSFPGSLVSSLPVQSLSSQTSPRFQLIPRLETLASSSSAHDLLPSTRIHTTPGALFSATSSYVRKRSSSPTLSPTERARNESRPPKRTKKELALPSPLPSPSNERARNSTATTPRKAKTSPQSSLRNQ